MPIEVVDIHNAIVKGLRVAWLNHFLMTDERDEDIKPEYLTTAAVCYAFSDFISNNSMNGLMTVRAEEKTRSLWIKTLFPLFMRIGNRFGLRSDSERKGNVDISLARKGVNLLETPFGVIENKGFLLFTKDNELYAESMAEVKKDLKRNIEFVSYSNDEGMEYSGFTFYLRDKNSVLESEGDNYIQCKKIYFEEVCQKLLSNCTGLNFEVEIDSLESNLFDSKTAAEEPDENGCPAYTAEGTWNILYGVISIYRTGNTVTHNKSFKIDGAKRLAAI